jgi:hypothetical protein
MMYKIENYVEQNYIMISLDGNLCVVESENGFNSNEMLEILCNNEWSIHPITMDRIIEISLKLKWDL